MWPWLMVRVGDSQSCDDRSSVPHCSFIYDLHLCVIFTTRHGMTHQRKNSSSSTDLMVDEARAHALRQYNDADGHFSLVRFVGNGSRDPN